MKGDFSRLRFDPSKNYTSVLDQQGRVSLDADTNEQCAINEYLRATEAVDVIGLVGGPIHDEGFRITVHNGAIQIGAGRYYVAGLQCEIPHSFTYSNQPFLIDPSPTDQALLSSLQQGSIGAIQVYLEVWRRFVTALDDPCLREPAIGQADTTGRVQTVWRVVARAESLQSGSQAGAAAAAGMIANNPKAAADCCKSMITGSVPVSDPGALGAKTGDYSGDCSCEPTPAAGYRGLENQLYRVEIHHGGDQGTATFKWSRENGSVVVAVSGVSGSNVYVDSLGPDPNLGFSVGQWVEISDDSNLFGQTPNQPGDLYQIQSVSPETLMVTMTQPVAWVDSTKNARMRRWDQFGSSADANGVALSAALLALENGIEIQFRKGQYVSGDHWLIPARTATGQIEWPPCGGGEYFDPAHRTEIFFAPLACIHWDSRKNRADVHDCRTPFYPLGELQPVKSTTCCKYRVGDGVESFGDFTSIQEAVDKLPPEGGEICLLAGRFCENVFIIGKRDVVIHGCGWQTRVASKSLQVTAARLPPRNAAANLPAPVNPVAAVFTIVGSQHVVLREFAVEAADDEAGILIDGTETSLSRERAAELARARIPLRGVIDAAIVDMVLTAAAWPAILAVETELLRIDRNRIAMKNVRSLWPAVFASGREIHIDHNWVGIQSPNTDQEWLPYTVATDLDRATGGSQPTHETVGAAPVLTREFISNTGLGLVKLEVALHPGGVQIGGPSTDVYILENEIEGGSRNGITLGSLDVLDTKGTPTGTWTGTLTTTEGDACDCTGTIQISGTYPGTSGYRTVAGGILTNVQIHRNRIRNMGLCGIGPVGFFDLRKIREIITIDGLNISGNEISRTLLRDLANNESHMALGYGAVCVPDVLNLTMRDNTITDFGGAPGAPVCGIFVLHGEVIEISRNHVVDARDWAGTPNERPAPATAVRGGIFILLGTPPTFTQSLNTAPVDVAVLAGASSTPIYVPGLPAVRVEHNVVRVPLSYALAIVGLGPFAIVNNHLSCGGLIRTTGTALAQTVLILNMGSAIEKVSPANSPTRIAFNSKNANAGIASVEFKDVSSGAVLFTNNICQLETNVSRQKEYASVLIVTPDHLIFSNNHCWFDTAQISALTDALLVGGSLNVIGNRFQEASESVLFSALTVGVVNVTGQNVSTFCIYVIGKLQSNNNNLVVANLLAKDSCKAGQELFDRLFN